MAYNRQVKLKIHLPLPFFECGSVAVEKTQIIIFYIFELLQL